MKANEPKNESIYDFNEDDDEEGQLVVDESTRLSKRLRTLVN